jgi:hypothetical protein
MRSRFRPLPYDETLAQEVLDWIAAGVLLRDLWRDPEMPTRGDLRRWRQADPKFEARVRAAVNAARSRRMLTLDEEVADAIYLRLCAGEPLPSICADPGMPGVATVYDWLRRDADFARTYALGREAQGWVLADRVWEATRPLMELTDKAGIDAIDSATRRLRWTVSKLAPKKYRRT